MTELTWHGPLSIPRLPTTNDEGIWKILKGPGLYLLLKEYPEGNVLVGYVGKAGLLHRRLCEHMHFYLGGYYLTRDSNGKYLEGLEDDWRMSWLNSLGKDEPADAAKLHEAIAETKRLRIFVAQCEEQFLNPAESMLIDRLKYLTKNENGEILLNGHRFHFEDDNGRRENFGKNYPEGLRLDFTFETDNENWRSALSTLLGSRLHGSLQSYYDETILRGGGCDE